MRRARTRQEPMARTSQEPGIRTIQEPGIRPMSEPGIRPMQEQPGIRTLQEPDYYHPSSTLNRYVQFSVNSARLLICCILESYYEKVYKFNV